MASFLLLIYGAEKTWDDLDESGFRAAIEAHATFGREHDAVLRGGEGLAPTATARTVRGEAVTDGPFLETKEALGGYYLVDVADIDAAIEVARHVPAMDGCVEVRPVMVLDGS